MKTYFKISVFLSITMLVLSCNKLDTSPTDRYTELNYWTSSDKADLVLNMAYSQMIKSDYFFYNEGLSDNAYAGRGDAQGVMSLSSGVYDPSLGRLDDEWKFHYQGIKTSNTLLENIGRVPGMDDGLRNRMIAEAKLLRAFHHFQLASWWGDVPLVAKDLSVSESQTIQRSPKSEVIAFVLKELDDAAAILPVNTSYSGNNIGRISKGAAIALKARVLLYEGRWSEVVTECAKLVENTGNGSYSLFPSYGELFKTQNENNSEVILSSGYVPDLRFHSEFIDFVPVSVGARLNGLAPTQELVNDYLMTNGRQIGDAGSGYDELNPYQDRDPRMKATVVYDRFAWPKNDGSLKTIYIKPGTDPDPNAPDEYKPGSVSSPTGYYIRKYFDSTANNFNSGLDLVVIRYADVLLMYAEAKNEVATLDQATWDKTIRLLRTRAGFTDPGALNFDGTWSQGQIRDIIRRERRTELAMEGLRIFDIRRWKTAETLLNGYVHGAKFADPAVDNGYIRANIRTFDVSKHYLWPVPRDERALNTKLSQNTGW
ncbi:RagB/SusD family nutrient uptake outer membrane protein [Flavitalea flava]